MRRALRLGVALVALACAVWYLTANFGALLAAAARIDPIMLALAGVLAIGYWLSLGWLWGAVQAPLGGGLGRVAAMRVWALSTVARYAPGNIWHVAGRSALTADDGGQPLAALSASAYEQVLTLAGALLVAGLVLPAVGGSPWLFAAGLAAPAALVALHPGLNRWIVVRVARLLKQ
ncbi:MAG: hypothetical protein NZ518_06860, partial [Dehalococcoidia bacterium]|nr:hypothetical protein [Dehalococcoidia bacterium]